jgi:hypothetical protein
MGAGTVGSGCVLEQSVRFGVDKFPWIKEGDEVVLEVERLGQLRNKVRRAALTKPIRGKIEGSRFKTFADKFNTPKKEGAAA